MATSQSMISAGQQVGSYRLLRKIGAGGMGTIYEALHATIGRRAALKILHAELAADSQIAARFLNEARATNRIAHPGFVEIYEFGHTAEGLPYIVMELLSGEPLSHRLRRFTQGTPVPFALELAEQLAAALAAAHERGIVHRDLKPDNIMLIPHLERPGCERVKILDLGIAKLDEAAATAASSPHTRTGIAMGTPQYMAPEQCIAASRVDGQADVYSLGVILYETLSGRRPFDGESALEVMNQQVRSTPTALRALRPELPAEIAAWVELLLAKDAGERPTMRRIIERAAHLGNLPAPDASDPLERPEPPPHTAPRLQAAAVAAKPAPAMPFIVGPPIADPRHFVGRQRELRRLSNLWQKPPLQNAAIVGPPRCGKTSVLLTLKNVVAGQPHRQEPRFDFLPTAGSCQFIYVDFQDPRLSTVDGLLRHLLAGLRLRVPTASSSASSAPEPVNLDAFMNAVAGRLHTATVILFDEIGVALQRYRELDATFWEGLRALAGNQTDGLLGFVLASHAPPHELAQHSLGGSPFFNIFGYCATLGPFSEVEARSLIGLSPLPFIERDIAWMLEQSERWPVLLQILCRERLLALYDGEEGDGWRDEALQQLTPFLHLRKDRPALEIDVT